jgi:type I restriction enzyme, S subunit
MAVGSSESALWFAVPARRLQSRADPAYGAAALVAEARYAKSRYPLEPLGTLATDVQYGTSARPGSEGVRVVRMGNLRDGGLDLRDHKRVSLSESELERYRLAPGDLLVNRTNSKDLVGKTAVFEGAGTWVFASYLIRIRLDTDRALPEFVAAFLNSPAGRLQIDRDSRQIIGMANINASELRRLLVPLPEPAVQADLADAVLDARSAAVAAQKAIETLDAEIDETLIDRLGIELIDSDNVLSFSVRSGALRGGRLDAPAFVPAVAGHEGEDVRALAAVADVNPKREGPQSVDSLVPYVGLPECGQRHVREVALRPAGDSMGRNVAIPGDILFARIEPSVFNRKYVYARDLHGYERVFTSNEFYVVRARDGVMEQDFLHELLLSQVTARQVKGKTTGSSGRRRIDRGLFERLAVPVPLPERQREIAAELRARRDTADRALAAATNAVQESVAAFESHLFRGS